MQKHKKIIGLIFGILILLMLIYTFYAKRYGKSKNIQSQLSASIYLSKNLRFSVIIPSNYQVKEDLTYVDFSAQEGKVTASRNATNFENIQEYIQDFDLKRTIVASLEKPVKIDGFDGIERVEKFGGGPVNEEKVYMFYVDGWVYSLSTSSKSLYDDLDQAIKSFKYIR